jgi:pyruvate kinase
LNDRAQVRKTKVIATLGPACDAPETLKAMMRAGMDVARLNLSHGTFAEHAQRLQRLRAAAADIGATVAVMADTKGIEIRTGAVEGGIAVLEAGAAFGLYTDERVGGPAGVSVTYPRLADELRPGAPVLLDDGLIELEVEKVRAGAVECRVRRGGVLGNGKGVNLPGVELSIHAVRPESSDELRFACEHDVEYLAASFVRTPEDIDEIRAFVESQGADIPIIAKIENLSGVQHLEGIVAAANGTMVARGDLGVELPVAEVPTLQKRIIRTTVMNGKPVITATQMLDSMERNPLPTRAEVSDVANAILDGTSAVMLSGETAIGKYPVEAVRTMAALALEAEASLPEFGHLQKILPDTGQRVTEAVSQAAITMARHLNAAAIFSLTETGFTSRQISKYRPDCPNLAITSSPKVVRRLAMNWGVVPLRYEGVPTDEAKIEFAIERARALGYVRSGDVVVATAGHSALAGTTNLIRVVTVDE